MRSGAHLNQIQIRELLAHVTHSDIDLAILAIDDGKSSWIDGLNAHFFKHAWEVIKLDIYEAVLDYFNQGIMYFPLNITAVTLIPKIANASSIKDYRPISCFSVVYKIISMILTAR